MHPSLRPARSFRDAHLVNVPTVVGGAGPEGVRDFYAHRLIGQFFPPDVAFTTVSRTYGHDRLIDELVMTFTRTTKMDWMLPGVEPTGRPGRQGFCDYSG